MDQRGDVSFHISSTFTSLIPIATLRTLAFILLPLYLLVLPSPSPKPKQQFFLPTSSGQDDPREFSLRHKRN